jgi:hypothetical protein
MLDLKRLFDDNYAYVFLTSPQMPHVTLTIKKEAKGGSEKTSKETVEVPWVTKTKTITWAVHVALMGQNTNGGRVLVRKADRKRKPGRPRRRWKDNITIYLTEVRLKGVD